MALVEGRKTEKTLQVLGTLAGGIPVRLHFKNETASKVAGSRGFSEVDAYGRVSFFPLGLGWVPKTFAYFSVFLSPAVGRRRNILFWGMMTV